MRICLKSPILAWNSLWNLGQTRFVATLLVELSLTLDMRSCLLFSASLTLSDADLTSTIHNNTPPDASFLSHGYPVIPINVETFQWCFKCVLGAFLLPPLVRFPDFSSPKSNFLGRRVSCILISWPVDLSWYFISKVWRLIMSARARTSVSRILSCHLILRSFLRQMESVQFLGMVLVNSPPSFTSIKQDW